MKLDFESLYGIVGLEPNPKLLAAREEAVGLIAGKLTEAGALDLLRLHLGAKQDDIINSLRLKEALQTTDADFSGRDNGLELQILSGAAIVKVLQDQPTRVSDIIALAMVSVQAVRRQFGVLVPDLTGYAEDYLLREGYRVRTLVKPRTIETPNKIPAILEQLQDYKTAAEAGTVPTTMVLETLAKVKQLTASLKAYSKATAAFEVTQNTNHKILQEEAQLLWWALNGRYREMGESFETIDVALTSLLAGEELAAITEFVPGHPYAFALLTEQLTQRKSGDSNVTIQEAVSKMPEQLRKKWRSGFSKTLLLDFCPVHAAVFQSLLAQGDVWFPGWGGGTIVNYSFPLLPARLAYQIYLECIMNRVAS